MGDSNDSATRPTRRRVLEAACGALVGLTVGTAADPVAAANSSVHEKMARRSAENVCDELDNVLCDRVDTITEYADDPDDDPYYCPGWYPDAACRFLVRVDLLRSHYKNTQHPTGELGTAPEEAATETAAAKRRVGDGNYIEAAIRTARALHFVQDAGTLVHAGRVVEQADDYSIRSEYEQWLADAWDDDFGDAADADETADVTSESDVERLTWALADRTHDDLEDRWHDIEEPGEYDDDTMVAQRDRIRDAATISNGTIRWIWKNA